MMSVSMSFINNVTHPTIISQVFYDNTKVFTNKLAITSTDTDGHHTCISERVLLYFIFLLRNKHFYIEILLTALNGVIIELGNHYEGSVIKPCYS